MKNIIMCLSLILSVISCISCNDSNYLPDDNLETNSPNTNTTLSSIEILYNKSVTYLNDFNEKEVELTAFYSDKTKEIYKNNDLEFNYNDFNSKKIGKYTIDVKVKKLDIQVSLNVEVVPVKSFNLLMIGNSFSDDTIQWVYEICDSLGITVKLGNLVIGGCSLDTHYSNYLTSSKSYAYRTYNKTLNSWQTTLDYDIKRALGNYEWDYVSLQQVSGLSGQPESYSNLQSLIEQIQKYSPNVKFIWNMTWAYQKDSTHNDFYRYENDQVLMYNFIVNTVNQTIKTLDMFEIIIPNGTAIQNARTSFIGDTLTRDGHHLTYDLGRYIAGLTLVKTITGVDVTQINYAPNGLSEEYIKIAIESCNNAFENPFSITNSTYTSMPTNDNSN